MVQRTAAVAKATALKRLLEVAARFVCARPVLNPSEDEKRQRGQLAQEQLRSMDEGAQQLPVLLRTLMAADRWWVKVRSLEHHQLRMRRGQGPGTAAQQAVLDANATAELELADWCPWR